MNSRYAPVSPRNMVETAVLTHLIEASQSFFTYIPGFDKIDAYFAEYYEY